MDKDMRSRILKSMAIVILLLILLRCSRHLSGSTASKFEQCGNFRNDTNADRPLGPIDDVTFGINHNTKLAMYNIIELMGRYGLRPKLLSRIVPTINKKSDTFVVPNVVHYIHFGEPLKFEFRHYLSVLGVHKFIRPDYILFHGDGEITGQWWTKLLADVPNLFHVWRRQPTNIHGRKIHFIQHTSDIVRLQVLYDFGGIYLDNDVLVAASFDPLRIHDFTLDREGKGLLATGVIIARRGAPFLRVWLETYRNYMPKVWLANSLEMAHTIATILPHLIHVEKGTLVFPNYRRLDLLYKTHYNWTQNYCIHLYQHEKYRFPSGPEELDNFHGASGEIMRHIYTK